MSAIYLVYYLHEMLCLAFYEKKNEFSNEYHNIRIHGEIRKKKKKKRRLSSTVLLII